MKSSDPFREIVGAVLTDWRKGKLSDGSALFAIYAFFSQPAKLTHDDVRWARSLIERAGLHSLTPTFTTAPKQLLR